MSVSLPGIKATVKRSLSRKVRKANVELLLHEQKRKACAQIETLGCAASGECPSLEALPRPYAPNRHRQVKREL